MGKDWTGNNKAVYACLGASNHFLDDRAENDFYATHLSAIEWLMQLERLSSHIWEPCVGQGHLAKPLIEAGYTVKCTDLIDRGFGEGVFKQ